MFLFKKPSVLFAFVEILLMWVFQLRSLLMSTSMYLTWSTASRACPCNIYMCGTGCLDFEMCNTLHLLGLKSISHRFSHVCNVSRSCCRVSESELLLLQCYLRKIGHVSVCSRAGRLYRVRTVRDQTQNIEGLQSWRGFLMSFCPPERLFESAQSERHLSRTKYFLLRRAGVVCVGALNDLLRQMLYWSQAE